MVCHNWFFNHGLSYDLTILCLNISDIDIITVKGTAYRCINHYISKSEAIHLLENSVLDDREYI